MGTESRVYHRVHLLTSLRLQNTRIYIKCLPSFFSVGEGVRVTRSNGRLAPALNGHGACRLRVYIHARCLPPARNTRAMLANTNCVKKHRFWQRKEGASANCKYCIVSQVKVSIFGGIKGGFSGYFCPVRLENDPTGQTTRPHQFKRFTGAYSVLTVFHGAGLRCGAKGWYNL